MSLKLQVVIAIGAIAAILCIGNLVTYTQAGIKICADLVLVGILLLILICFGTFARDVAGTRDYTTDQYVDILRSFVCADDNI